MKTIIKFLLVSCIITAAAITNFKLVHDNRNVNVTLPDIEVMAKAVAESSNDRGPMCYDDNWKEGCRLIEGFCSTAAKADC